MADKVIELLRLMEKFGVKPGKIIGAGDRKVTPIKKPILTKQLNRDYIDQDVKDGKIGTNTVKNEIEDVDLAAWQQKLMSFLPDEVKPYLTEAQETHLEFPVLKYPEKPKSLNLSKTPSYSGVLKGIKGQYLIFEDDTVFNVRSNEGLIVTLSV